MEDFKETKKIQFAESNTIGALNPLISFNCLVDTDFGLLVLIAQKFFDLSVFNESFFIDNDNVNDMKKTIYNRKDINPLLLCIKNKKDADDYYKQFFDQYYMEILERSMITDFGNEIENIASQCNAIVTILCTKQEEIDFLNKLNQFNKFSTILSRDCKSNYNQFFFKDYRDIDKRLIDKDFIDKHIYIGRYHFTNTDHLSEDDFKTYSIIDNLRNIITQFDLYKNMKG